MRPGSAMVGDSPAACTSDRNGPSSATRAANARTASGSLTSHATPTVPSRSGARRSTATNWSTLPRSRSMHARPMPLAAPVTTPTVIALSLSLVQRKV